tara:strand:+ start:35 stop:1075 length:1041 start_codon:yes stop_codon:yes gene_type:complete
VYFLYSRNQSFFEIEYIEKVLLSKISNLEKIPIDSFNDFDTNENIILYFSDGDQKISNEIKNFAKKFDKRYFLIHISDEILKADYSIYKKAIYIFRGYYSPFIKNKNCFTIPIGFQSGFLQDNSYESNLKKRKLVWSFFGQFYSDRKYMLNQLSVTKPNKQFKVNSFMDSNAIGVADLRKVYSDTVFAPCPFGFGNPDTFRIMEVLESGCIPIVKKFIFIDYFKFVFGNHPFLIVKNWSEAPGLIDLYMNNKDMLQKKEKEIEIWYKKFKSNLSNDIYNVIQKNNLSFSSNQKFIQDRGKFNIIVLFTFFYYFSLRKRNIFIKMSKLIYIFKQKMKFIAKWNRNKT